MVYRVFTYSPCPSPKVLLVWPLRSWAAEGLACAFDDGLPDDGRDDRAAGGAADDDARPVGRPGPAWAPNFALSGLTSSWPKTRAGDRPLRSPRSRIAEVAAERLLKGSAVGCAAGRTLL